ncbi:MAG: helix-turn-helix transcriptional regulator, partial [Phycisphaerae bacterium]
GQHRIQGSGPMSSEIAQRKRRRQRFLLCVPAIEARLAEIELTKVELAFRAGVATGTVFKALAAKPITLPPARRIARALGVKLADIATPVFEAEEKGKPPA